MASVVPVTPQVPQQLTPQQQQHIQQQRAQMAQQTGLPVDAPFAEIDAFLKTLQKTKGTTKTNSLDGETKKKAENAIINYMKQQSQSYLRIKDKYLVLKEDVKMEGWSDELVCKAFVVFHRRNMNQGSLEDVALAFVEFCKEVRKGTNEKKYSLSLQSKRPYAATFAMLQQMGTM